MNNFRLQLLKTLMNNNKVYAYIDKTLNEKAMDLAQNHCYNGKATLSFTKKDIEIIMKAKLTSNVVKAFDEEVIEAVFCWQAKNSFNCSLNSVNKLLEEDKFYFYVPLNLLNVTDDALLFKPFFNDL